MYVPLSNMQKNLLKDMDKKEFEQIYNGGYFIQKKKTTSFGRGQRTRAMPVFLFKHRYFPISRK